MRENGTGSSSSHIGQGMARDDDIAESCSPAQVPIAICGMGMRLPGGIRDPAAFYDFLVGMKDARRRTTNSRYDTGAYYSPHDKRGAINTEHGYWLDDVDLAMFDHSMFKMSQTEIKWLDPQQRLLLEVVWETFESASESAWGGKTIGCYVGTWGDEWLDIHSKDAQGYDMHRITGCLDLMVSNRISYEFDLRGPSMTVKTGCSSSGQALHLACQAIRQGECASAIVAGSNLLLGPGLSMAMSTVGALSPDGSCKTFDASANGYARAEAVNALYIKRLDAALRDGNPIRAVIRGTACNSNGRTPGIVNPNREAQESLIRRAYETTGLQDISQTAMVECHGSGTALGDFTEANAIADVFGSKGVYIGSLKPNFGHSEGASAITSIIKATLSLENRMILPNIKFHTPNPKIPFAEAGLIVPVEATPWPRDRLERISVSSFGIGGTNVHMILDSAASFGLGRLSNPSDSQSKANKPPSLLVFSSSCPESLQDIGQLYDGYIARHPNTRMEDLAYTLAHHRNHLEFRAFCVADGCGPLQSSSPTKAQSMASVAFIFTGQGAQWVGMGQELMSDYPSFLADIRALDKCLQRIEQRPTWSIEEELLAKGDATMLDKAEYAQPICTALQIALVNLLARWGIRPAAVTGHSSGEIAAAYAAGVLTMTEAMLTGFFRGYACAQQDKPGGMVAVGLGEAQVVPYLRNGVTVACINSKSSVTLSGNSASLDGVITIIQKREPDVFVRRLKVDKAYHSAHMRDIGRLYAELLEKRFTPQKPRVPFYSTVKGATLDQGTDFGPSYWRENLESPVLFDSTILTLLNRFNQGQVHLEVGPHSGLAAPLRQIYKQASASVHYVPCLIRNKHSSKSFLGALGQMHSVGVQLEFPGNPTERQALTDLPLRRWHYDKPFWAESRIEREWRYPKSGGHDILGRRVLEGSDLEPTWRLVLHPSEVPWIKDHRVNGTIVFPAAGYIAMAGEASNQLSGARDYTVRDVSLSTVMLLDLEHSTEIITRLRPQRLTDTDVSTWYEFTIESHDGDSWIRHCRGFVRGGTRPADSSPGNQSYSRKVCPTRWYTNTARIGFSYGPMFMGLEDISSGVNESTAAATVGRKATPFESSYTLHPTELDLALQSLNVAKYRGQPRLLRILQLPTHIEEICVREWSGPEMRVHSWMSGEDQGHAYARCGNDVVLSVKGLSGTTIHADDVRNERNPQNAAHLQWKPDFDCLDTSTLIKPIKPRVALDTVMKLLERLFLLCAMECQDKLGKCSPALPYLGKYRAWINAELERAQQPGHPIVEDWQSLAAIPKPDRQRLISVIVAQLDETDFAAAATAIMRVHDQADEVFEGRTSALELLMQDDLLTRLYNSMSTISNYSLFFSLLGNSKPHMNILEIGAGTGGLTAVILEHLQSNFGERLYFKYTFTDISAGFFPQAKDRFKEYPGIEYRTLDISQDPSKQGFEAGEYDLIVASNVLHATPDLSQTLSHVRYLLHPGGRLFLQELCPESKWVNFIFGLLPGWWLGGEDGRVDEPFISPEQWETRLCQAGLLGIDSVTMDHVAPYHINANILTKPGLRSDLPRKVALVSRSEPLQVTLDTERILREEGLIAEHFSWGQTLPNEHDVIVFADLEASLFATVDGSAINELKSFLLPLQQRKVLWLTKLCQMGPKDPSFAHILGVARVIRSELSMSLATLELEHWGQGAANAITAVSRKLRTYGRNTSEVEPDMEFIWAGGMVHLGRFHWFSMADSLHGAVDTPAGCAKKLSVAKPGLLQSLTWIPSHLPLLAPDMVQVSVRAAGLNFKDCLIALGQIDAPAGVALGFEGSGVVTNVGSEVKHLSIGDRVMFGTDSGAFATECQVPGDMCIRIPEQLSFQDAATMLCVYLTVFLSLIERARLHRGQSVLIHSAAGGVGTAAIHLARWLGAEIFATVGTEEKREHLMSSFGIPADRIFNSHSAEFRDQLMSATNGRGVDVVLNSLSGELLHESWKCVAAGGCMIELGKRDILGHGQLDMSLFADNRAFFGVDVGYYFGAVGRRTLPRVMEQILHWYTQGHIKPIHPVAVFDAPRIEDAFRSIQRETHMGKIVITFPEQDKLPVSSVAPRFVLRGDASYLLVGGMGGLGRSAATWLVSNGATSLMFLSRSAGQSDEDRAFLEELHQLGCSTQVVAGDIADAQAVANAVQNAAKPIAGVLHLALVVKNLSFADMDPETWNAVVRPRVQGAWNLHHALPKNLDFFVIFGSISGICGSAGQTNYAASNTFLDAFVQYRQSLGLVASVIDIGLVEEVGYLSQLPEEALTSFKRSGSSTVLENDVLEALMLAILRSRPHQEATKGVVTGNYYNAAQFAVGLGCDIPILSQENTVSWKRDPRMAIYRNMEQQSSIDSRETGDPVLEEFLISITRDPGRLDDPASADLVSTAIARRIFHFILQDRDRVLDTSLTLADAGVDSMALIELRNWWKGNFGGSLPATDAIRTASFDQIGALAIQQLKEKHGRNTIGV